MPVHLLINSSKIVRQNQRETLQHEKTDWVKLRKIIDKNLILTDAVTPAEIDATVNNIANIISSKLIKLKRKMKRIAQKTNKTDHKNLANRIKILASKAIQNDRTHGGKQKHKKLIRQKTVKICGKTFTKLAVKKHRQRLTTLLLKKTEIQQKTI